MKAIDDLHRLGRPLANAIRRERTPIATDHGDRRVPGEPSGDYRRRALWKQVYNAMCHQLDEDGAIPRASPPRPLIHPDGLQG
jgi:hypothetical protein